MTRLVAFAANVGVLVGLTIPTASALAANRTVCFDIEIRDARTRCPSPVSPETGALRECNTRQSGSDSFGDIKGFIYELWDKDSGTGSNDDLINTYWLSGTGARCATFEWEAIAGGEANPDVYIVLKNAVRGSSGGEELQARHGDGSTYTETTWRDGESGLPDKYTAVDCTTGGNCNIDSLSVLLPTDTVTSQKSLMLMVLDSGQRALEAFDGSMNGGGTITAEVDQDADFAVSCPTACAVDRTTIRVPTDTSTGALHGDRVTHELGHVFQMREFGQDFLTNDCTRGTSPPVNNWSVASTEFNSCATTEGWASYVAAASWYDSENAGTIPLYANTNLESATMLGGASTCATADDFPGQAAKAFWDMDDVNNESGVSPAAGQDDGNDLTRDFLLNQWDDFPNGTANRDDGESDVDGVNLWDYRFNAPIGDEETFIQHNCEQNQDTN
jgi:hypothetical protein